MPNPIDLIDFRLAHWREVRDSVAADQWLFAISTCYIDCLLELKEAIARGDRNLKGHPGLHPTPKPKPHPHELPPAPTPQTIPSASPQPESIPPAIAGSSRGRQRQRPHVETYTGIVREDTPSRPRSVAKGRPLGSRKGRQRLGRPPEGSDRPGLPSLAPPFVSGGA